MNVNVKKKVFVDFMSSTIDLVPGDNVEVVD